MKARIILGSSFGVLSLGFFSSPQWCVDREGRVRGWNKQGLPNFITVYNLLFLNHRILLPPAESPKFQGCFRSRVESKTEDMESTLKCVAEQCEFVAFRGSVTCGLMLAEFVYGF